MKITKLILCSWCYASSDTAITLKENYIERSTLIRVSGHSYRAHFFFLSRGIIAYQDNILKCLGKS